MVKLREIRIAMGVSQKRLAEMSGVPQQTISAIETGERENPGVNTLRILADALGCTIDEMCPSGANGSDQG